MQNHLRLTSQHSIMSLFVAMHMCNHVDDISRGIGKESACWTRIEGLQMSSLDKDGPASSAS